MKVVNERVQADGYDVVFDKSGLGAGGIKALMASRQEMDFSEDIITALNKNQPAPGATPAATPKPAAKKPAPKK